MDESKEKLIADYEIGHEVWNYVVNIIKDAISNEEYNHEIMIENGVMTEEEEKKKHQKHQMTMNMLGDILLSIYEKEI